MTKKNERQCEHCGTFSNNRDVTIRKDRKTNSFMCSTCKDFYSTPLSDRKLYIWAAETVIERLNKRIKSTQLDIMQSIAR